MSDIKFFGDLSLKMKEEASENKERFWKLQIILTKCDLVERAKLARRLAAMRDQLSDSSSTLPSILRDSFLNIMPVSCRNFGGILELQSELASLVPVQKPNEKVRGVASDRLPSTVPPNDQRFVIASGLPVYVNLTF